MDVRLMIRPPLAVAEELITRSKELLAKKSVRTAQDTLLLANFYLQVARFAEPPCGAVYADAMEAEIDWLKEHADALVAALPPEDER